MTWRAWAALTALLCAGVSVRAEFTIRWITNTTPPAVEVEGIPREALASLRATEMSPARWPEIFAVYAEQVVDPAAPPMYFPPIAGTWKIVGPRLRFEPRFPFERGVVYRAEFWSVRLPGTLGIPAQLLAPQGNGEPVRPVYSFLELPAERASAATIVTQIFPTADVLPENQLKFYVHFSGPMSRGGVYEHVQLRDASGRVIELAFLDLAEELWDLTMTRLTLLIDPGRIKRGVKPLEDVGPVFEAGKSYTLTIGVGARDVRGQPLREAFIKKFKVGPADRTPPDPQRWRIHTPKPGTRTPLVVEFDEPMDAALATRLIALVGPSNPNAAAAFADPIEKGPANASHAIVRGAVEVGAGELSWKFLPTFPWMPGGHQLMIATTIEDLAGNNIGKPFDVDLAEGARRTAPTSVKVEFEVK